MILPENGWFLFGSMQCLRMQRRDEARLTEKRFLEVFARAGVALMSTRF